MSELVYIGLGSNLNSPVNQINDAFAALEKLPESKLLIKSSLYRSAPMGPQDQDDFINAVAQLETQLTPVTLLDQLQFIEQQQGRVRKEQQWGPRTLDLDLLLFGNLVISSERLTIPHYGISERTFVLFPLLEIAPNLTLPDGTSIKQIVEPLTEQGITKL